MKILTFIVLSILTIANANATSGKDKDDIINNTNSLHNNNLLHNTNTNNNLLHNTNTNNNSNLLHNNNTIDVSSSASSNQTQDQTQDQSQTQSQQSNANNANYNDGSASSHSGGNTMNTSYHYSTPRNNPNISTFVPMPTSPCIVNFGGSAAFSGIGFSATGGITNENCEQIELSKAFAAIGERGASLEILCRTKHAQSIKPAVCTNNNSVSLKQQSTADEVVNVTTTAAGTKHGTLNGKAVWYHEPSAQWLTLY